MIGARGLTCRRDRSSIGRAMPRPSHIYASSLDRRDRRWRRRRAIRPEVVLAVLLLLVAAVAGVIVVLA